MYAGDYALGTTIDVKFTTRRFATGAPFTLAGTPAVSAYPDNSTTELTAGITLTVDFDARTGLNNVRVVATGANGYVAGTSYALVLTAGTVDSVSVVGEVIGSFTLERAATFSRLGAPVGVSVSADIATVQADTDNIQTRLPAALVSGRIDANVGAMAAAVVTAAAIATDAIDADALAADALAEIKTQAVAALNTDTYAESASVPAATASLVDKIRWLATLARNKITQTATTQTLRNDADAASVATATVSDDGTTFTRNEWT